MWNAVGAKQWAQVTAACRVPTAFRFSCGVGGGL